MQTACEQLKFSLSASSIELISSLNKLGFKFGYNMNQITEHLAFFY